MPQIPYTQQTRDLSRLVQQRVMGSVHSVLQLSDEIDEQFLITLAAVSATAGMWVGVHDLRVGADERTDLPTALRILAALFDDVPQ